MTSFPIFVDYNVNSSNKTANDVGYTNYGGDVGTNQDYPGNRMDVDFDDLAYGFGYKWYDTTKDKYFIGFSLETIQLTNTSIFPEDINFTSGQRKVGFDWHFTTPPHVEGTFTVDLEQGGTIMTSSRLEFLFVKAPTVSFLSPPNGPTAGGTTVSVFGTNFVEMEFFACRFGVHSVKAKFVSSTHVECIAPPQQFSRCHPFPNFHHLQGCQMSGNGIFLMKITAKSNLSS